MTVLILSLLSHHSLDSVELFFGIPDPKNNTLVDAYAMYSPDTLESH